MPQLSAAIDRIKPSPTLAMTSRVLAMTREGIDVIGLSAGEPDFDTPDFVKEAAIAAIRKGQTKYTDVGGTPELRAAVAAKFARDNSLTYTTDQVIVSVGGKHTLFNALCATVDAGIDAATPRSERRCSATPWPSSHGNCRRASALSSTWCSPVRGATVGRRLRAVAHPVVAKHGSNPQAVVGEHLLAAHASSSRHIDSESSLCGGVRLWNRSMETKPSISPSRAPRRPARSRYVCVAPGCGQTSKITAITSRYSLADVAALIGEPTRAAMLLALFDGAADDWRKRVAQSTRADVGDSRRSTRRLTSRRGRSLRPGRG